MNAMKTNSLVSSPASYAIFFLGIWKFIFIFFMLIKFISSSICARAFKINTIYKQKTTYAASTP